MKKYIQRYNITELLDTMYVTSSYTEHILQQLIESLNENTIQFVLKGFFQSLFENNHFLHASVPLSILTDCQRQLSEIDPNLLVNFQTVINHFSVLIALLEVFNQIHKVQNENMFEAIIKSFRDLCWNSVPPASILIFMIILYQHAQFQASYMSPVYADNLPYGITVLMILFNLVRFMKNS